MYFQDNKSVMEILENSPRVVKTLADDEPESIDVYFYNGIRVTYFGVVFIPEHCESETLLKFDKFFNIDAALNGL